MLFWMVNFSAHPVWSTLYGSPTSLFMPPTMTVTLPSDIRCLKRDRNSRPNYNNQVNILFSDGISFSRFSSQEDLPCVLIEQTMCRHDDGSASNNTTTTDGFIPVGSNLNFDLPTQLSGYCVVSPNNSPNPIQQLLLVRFYNLTFRSFYCQTLLPWK